MDGCLEAGYKDADPAHKSCNQNEAVQEDVKSYYLHHDTNFEEISWTMMRTH